MLFSKNYNLAFLHYMRCGGTSISQWFRNNLDCTEVIKVGWHEKLEDKIQVIPEILDAQILCAVRNPFDLVLSIWHIWRSFPIGWSDFTDAAHKLCFDDFVIWFTRDHMTLKSHDTFMSYQDFTFIQGQKPKQISFIKVETLQEDFSAFILSLFPDLDPTLPVKNTMDNPNNKHRTIKKYEYQPEMYTVVTSRLVREAFPWVFKEGLYSSDPSDVKIHWRPNVKS